jgi:hypothetical protein
MSLNRLYRLISMGETIDDGTGRKVLFMLEDDTKEAVLTFSTEGQYVKRYRVR